MSKLGLTPTALYMEQVVTTSTYLPRFLALFEWLNRASEQVESVSDRYKYVKHLSYVE